MPFRLGNAPATFQQPMERVLAAVPRSRCVVYLDDLLVRGNYLDKSPVQPVRGPHHHLLGRGCG